MKNVFMNVLIYTYISSNFIPPQSQITSLLLSERKMITNDLLTIVADSFQLPCSCARSVERSLVSEEYLSHSRKSPTIKIK